MPGLRIKHIVHENIITLDGPAGSGKSTVAHELAKKLNLVHVNTGAIYRTFAWIIHENLATSSNEENKNLSSEHINNAVEKIRHSYEQNDVNHEFFLNGINITENIYAPEISNLSSIYAQNPTVRSALLPIQRNLIQKYSGAIVDGRDMGTVVFPNAFMKIFLTADINIRAKRREAELRKRGLHVNFETLLNEMKERDMRDSTRAIAPSKPASDAIIIDSSSHSIDEIVDQIFSLYHELKESKK